MADGLRSFSRVFKPRNRCIGPEHDLHFGRRWPLRVHIVEHCANSIKACAPGQHHAGRLGPSMKRAGAWPTTSKASSTTSHLGGRRRRIRATRMADEGGG